jgi:type II secretory pathway predicted ATPase ExeA
MVLDFYNLKKQPFGVTADPGYLYMSPTHREALASLCYGIQSGRGFMSLVAKPGMGKTTILFRLLDQLKGSARTIYLFQTLCRPEDLLRGLLRDLGVVNESADVVQMQEQLNQVLFSEANQGRKVVVVIDEAQNLEDSALELVRMLSNFETTSDKLMQIVLAGQPQLREKLTSPHLLQLRQRTSINARLQPLSQEETRLYINHRLGVAGYDFRVPLFSPQAEAVIAKYSNGIPRNINNICFNALSLGWVLRQPTIQKDVIRETLDDLDLSLEGSRDGDDVPASKLFSFMLDRPRTVFPRLLSPSFLWRFLFSRSFLSRSGAWRTRVAIFVIIALLLASAIVFRNRLESTNFHSLTSVRAAAPTETNHITSANPSDQKPANVVVDDQHQSQPRPSPNDAVIEQPKTTQAEPSTRAKKTRTHRQHDTANLHDPSKLWALVKKKDTNAEVELARMYLDGTGVPQNCTQAQILLEAASRKGSARASDLLSDAAGQCP